MNYVYNCSMDIIQFLQQDLLPTNDTLLIEEYNSIDPKLANKYTSITDKFIKDWEYSIWLREAIHYLTMEYYLFQKWLVKSTFNWQ